MNELFWLLPDHGFWRFACDACWQTAVLAGLTWGTLQLFRRPAVRSWLIVVGLVLCLAAPLLSWMARSQGVGLLPAMPAATELDRPARLPSAGDDELLSIDLIPSETIPAAAASAGADRQHSASAPRAEGMVAEQLVQAAPPLAGNDWNYLALLAATVVGLWLLATAWLVFRMGMSVFRVAQMIRHAVPCDDEQILRACRDAAARLSLPRLPRVFVCEHVSCPTVTAWGPSCVFVPCVTRRGTDWFAVFCHELAHVRRGDGWRRLLIELSMMVFPWQPLIWLLRREHDRACEEACDDWALFAGADPLQYARTLTLWIPRRITALASGFVSRKVMIRRRIERLLHTRPTVQPRVGGRFVLAGVTCSLVLLAAIALLQPGSFSFASTVTGTAVDDAAPPLLTNNVLLDNLVLHRLGNPRLKHGRRARPLGFDASGKILISTSESIGAVVDNTIRYWNATNGELMHTIPHDDRGVALTPDRQQLVVGRVGGIVDLIDVGTARVIRSLQIPVPRGALFAISGDATRLAISGSHRDARKLISVWNLITGELISEFKVAGIRSRNGFALSIDGRLLAETSGQSLTIWNVDSGTCAATFPATAEAGAYLAVAFAVDDQSVVAAGYRGQAQVCSVESLQPTATFAIPTHVQSISFSPDGRWMVTEGYHNITMWKGTTGEQVWQRELAPHDASLDEADVVFSPDGTLLAVGIHNHVQLLHADSAQELQYDDVSPEYSVIALHPQAEQLALATTDGRVRVWDEQLQQMTLEWRAHAARIRQLCYSPDGKLLATASDDRSIVLWDARTGELKHRLPQRLAVAPYYVCFSPDSRTLVTSCEGSRTNVWSTGSGELLQHFSDDRGGLRGPAEFSPDQSTLFMIDSRYHVTLRDPADGKIKQTLTDPREPVAMLALSSDGTKLAAGYFTRLLVWDVASQTLLMKQDTKDLTALSFARDRQLVTSFGDGRLEFWNLEQQSLVRTIHVDELRTAVSQMVFSDRHPRAYLLNANGTVDVLGM